MTRASVRSTKAAQWFKLAGWSSVAWSVPTPTLKIALGDVDNLIEHHPKSTNPGRGRPSSDEGPLLRSCVLLAYVAWEVYVEDSMVWAVEQLAHRSQPDQLPKALRKFVADISADPWQLAGDAWRQAAVGSIIKRVRGDGNGFGVNTAGPHQVIALHKQILGEDLLIKCRWPKMPASRVKEELADLVRIRGEITHTGRPPRQLHLKGVRSWREFVQHLARNIDGRVEFWVTEHIPERDPPREGVSSTGAVHG